MSAVQYRRYAAECFQIAEATSNLQYRATLMHMARSWLQLAERAEKNITSDLGYEAPPSARERPVMQQQQQQQQTQPEKKGE